MRGSQVRVLQAAPPLPRSSVIDIRPEHVRRAGSGRRAVFFIGPGSWALPARAEQPQQHQEQVDEVQIKRQRAHDRLLGGGIGAVDFGVHVLDLLRVVGGQADEHQDPDHRNHEMHDRALQEHVDDAGDDDADQAHEHERAQSGEVALGGVAVQAHAGKRARGDEEHAGDGGAGVGQRYKEQITQPY